MSLIPRETVEAHHQTIWQENAAEFATRQDTYVDQERRQAVRRTIELLVEEKFGPALFHLVKSVERQARISGVGQAEIPACPCGGRCKEHVR